MHAFSKILIYVRKLKNMISIQHKCHLFQCYPKNNNKCWESISSTEKRLTGPAPRGQLHLLLNEYFLLEHTRCFPRGYRLCWQVDWYGACNSGSGLALYLTVWVTIWFLSGSMWSPKLQIPRVCGSFYFYLLFFAYEGFGIVPLFVYIFFPLFLIKFEIGGIGWRLPEVPT